MIVALIAMALCAPVLLGILMRARPLSLPTWVDRETAGYQRMSDAMDRAALEFGETCEICNGAAVYLCPHCKVPIESHSHENDYICATHSFVNPIRQVDGARINGDGRTHRIQVIG